MLFSHKEECFFYYHSQCLIKNNLSSHAPWGLFYLQIVGHVLQSLSIVFCCSYLALPPKTAIKVSWVMDGYLHCTIYVDVINYPCHWHSIPHHDIIMILQQPIYQYSWAQSLTLGHGVLLVKFIFNSLQSSDTIWRHRPGSTLVQVMACCLVAPRH